MSLSTLGFRTFSDKGEKEKVAVLTESNFDKSIKKGVVVVDFFATWCRPCMKQAPIVEELAGEMKKISFGKVNIDQNKVLSKKYGVRSIPTLIVFKNGKEQERVIGLHDKATLQTLFNKYTK